MDTLNNVNSEGGNLAYYLIQNGYIANENLFVFNYPNEDVVVNNAEIFRGYINKLIIEANNSTNAFFRLAFDVYKGNFSFNIVAHSMGGLVARYYIENLGCDEYVEKLITIDTPHWGSGYSDDSDMISFLHALCDHDLDVNSAMFGGSNASDEGCESCEETYDLTEALDYTIERQTKYYAISGVDYSCSVINLNDYTCEILEPQNLTTYSDLKSYLTSYNQNLVMEVKWVGDNVVGLMSQIGWTESDGYEPDKVILMEKIFIDFDTNGGNGYNIPYLEMSNHFYGKIQHRTQVMEKIKIYLQL